MATGGDCVLRAIVLAGGLGTRLRSVVNGIPKPMAPINGVPFLEHLLSYWIDAGVGGIVASVGYRYEKIVEHFGPVYRGAPISYVIEHEPLGTGGGVFLALNSIDGDEPVLLLNGDAFFDVPLDKLLTFHRESAADVTFSLFRSAEAGRYGRVELIADGQIVALGRTRASVGELANGGVYVLRPAAFRGLADGFPSKVSLEDDVLPAMLTHGAVCSVSSARPALSISVYPPIISALQARLAQRCVCHDRSRSRPEKKPS